MNILLTLSAVTILVAGIAEHAGHAAGQPGRRTVRLAAAPSDGVAPDLVRGAIRRAVRFDQLAPLLAKAR